MATDWLNYGSTIHRTLEYQLNNREGKSMNKNARCIKDYHRGELNVFRGEICNIVERNLCSTIYHNNKRVCDIDSCVGSEYFKIIEEEKEMGEMGKSIWFDSMYLSLIHI